MMGKILGLLLLAVAVAMLLIGNQLIALVCAATGVLFLLYSFGDRDQRDRRNDGGGVWGDGGTSSNDNNGCDIGSSAGDGGCGGDGGGGGGGD
jgi:hypothetical protein